MSIKTFKTKKVFKIFEFFFSTVKRVRCAVVGKNLTPIGEYSSTVKNQRKCATVYCCVVVKGLNDILQQAEGIP
jgi:hypothetical protein